MFNVTGLVLMALYSLHWLAELFQSTEAYKAGIVANESTVKA
jgi:hypothetical protein